MVQYLKIGKIDKEALSAFLEELEVSAIGDDGKEYPNPIPVELDVTPRPATLKEQIDRLLHRALQEKMTSAETESYDEANDFDCEDDFEPLSQYELKDAVPEVPNTEDYVPKDIQKKPDSEGNQPPPEAVQAVPEDQEK